MKFGEQIKYQRNKLGLTQLHVANKLYVTRQTVSNWEQGKSYPDLNMLVKISDVYQVSIDSLLKEDQQLKEFLSKKEVQEKYDSTNTATIFLVAFASMAIAIITSPATFPHQLQSIVAGLISATILIWILRDTKFSEFIEQKKDTSFAAKLVQSKILIGLIVICTGYTVVVNLISLITGKQALTIRLGNASINLLDDSLINGGATSSIILFISGIVLIVARLFYVFARKWYQKLVNKHQN